VIRSHVSLSLIIQHLHVSLEAFEHPDIVIYRAWPLAPPRAAPLGDPDGIAARVRALGLGHQIRAALTLLSDYGITARVVEIVSPCLPAFGAYGSLAWLAT
jgi:hypothetical protein